MEASDHHTLLAPGAEMDFFGDRAGANRSRMTNSRAGRQSQVRSQLSPTKDAPPQTTTPGTRMQSRTPFPQLTNAQKCQVEAYKSEAKTRSAAGKYAAAIQLYTRAIDLDPNNSENILARAAAYFEMGNYDSTLEDANNVLEFDKPSDKLQALYLKGEALYQQGEFELAVLCYYKARSIKPGLGELDRGVQKCHQAIENSIGERSGCKLDMCGDLSYFEKLQESNMSSIEFLAELSSGKKRQKQQLSSASSASITSEMSATEETTAATQAAPVRGGSGMTRKQSAARSARTIKQQLEELYKDHTYLANLLNEQNQRLDGLEGKERVEEANWKKRVREKRDAQRTKNPTGAGEEELEDDALVPRNAIKLHTLKKQKGFAEDVREIVEGELSYLNERCEFWRKQQRSGASNRRHPGDDDRESPTGIIWHEIDMIEKDQEAGDHGDSLKKAHKLMHKLNGLDEEDAPTKKQLMSTVHSLIGNAHFEMELYDKALKAFQKDLTIAEEIGDKEANGRALDNLSKTYIKMEQYTRAIETFERKKSIVTTPLEITWLYHELGRCYVEIRKITDARACANHAIKAANEADDKSWKLNAKVLLAQVEVESKHYKEAVKQFGEALDYTDGPDDPAWRAIQRALSRTDSAAATSARRSARATGSSKKKRNKLTFKDGEDGDDDDKPASANDNRYDKYANTRSPTNDSKSPVGDARPSSVEDK